MIERVNNAWNIFKRAVDIYERRYEFLEQWVDTHVYSEATKQKLEPGVHFSGTASHFLSRADILDFRFGIFTGLGLDGNGVTLARLHLAQRLNRANVYNSSWQLGNLVGPIVLDIDFLTVPLRKHRYEFELRDYERSLRVLEGATENYVSDHYSTQAELIRAHTIELAVNNLVASCTEPKDRNPNFVQIAPTKQTIAAWQERWRESMSPTLFN